MTARHPPKVAFYLQHILDATARIHSYVAQIADAAALELDFKSQDAVVRNIEIIGEAANKIAKVDPDFLVQHLEIEWVATRGMRNRLVHDYFEIDFGLVWQTVQLDLPGLEQKVRKALDSLVEPGSKE